MIKVPPEIKVKLPIDKLADLLGIKLERQTERLAHALCPFHNDTAPSFVLNKLSGTARCFSSACADLPWPMGHVELIQYYEHLAPEMALDRLYALAGEERVVDSAHDLLRRAVETLHANVTHEKSMAFFKERGITKEVLDEFLVGYSPSFQWFREQIAFIPPDQAAQLELMRPPMFEDTIVYPQFDSMGRVSGIRVRTFSGLPSKYVGNSGEFKLKPSRLYGLHTVKRGQRSIILVEGPNDVLSLRAAGISNVVGLQGLNTRNLEAFLSEHGFSDVTLLTDGDDAGRMAVLQAPPLVKAIAIPEPLDPDQYVVKYGMMGILELVSQAKFPIEYIVESRLAVMPKTVSGRVSFIKGLARDLSEGLPPILIQLLKGRVAEALDMTKDDVDSIFGMVDIDPGDLERRLSYHLASAGPMAEDIKMKITPRMFTDPRIRKQIELMYEGLSPSEMPPKIEGLTQGDIDRFLDINRRRQVKTTLSKLTNSVSNMAVPLEDVVTRAITGLSDNTNEEVDILDAGELLQIGVADARARMDLGGKFPLSFGTEFAKTNQLLQGLRPNSMYVLAATQGVGKSALAFDWALSLACADNIPVLWVSLEMSRSEMAVRALSKLTGLSAYNIQTGSLTDTEINILSDHVVQYMNSPLHYIDAGSLSINQIVALVRKMKMTKGIQVLFLDYLQLIGGGDTGQSMYERVGYISRMIKSGITMEKNIGLPVVAIAQLSRQAAKSEAPTAEHIAESYKISQDADVVMTLRRRSEAEIASDGMKNQNFGNYMLHIDKNRSGQSKQPVGLMFNPVSLRFKEV